MSYFNNSQYVITITLYSEELNEEFDMNVKVNYLPGEDQTYWDPGCDPEIEIIDIDDDDFPVNISYNDMWSLIYEYEDKEYNLILKQIKDIQTQWQDDYADYLYESRKYNF